jgi:SpoVK/Ycf46/Vps4 family AAA+-type ATPase
MSSKILHDMILQANERLQSILATDQHANLSDKQTSLSLIAEYLEIYTLLEECYDQTIQTQRRVNIRKMLQATVTRLIEIIQEAPHPLDSTVYSKWEGISQSIMAQTLTNDLKIPIPRIVKDLQDLALKVREETIRKEREQFEEAERARQKTMEPPMPLEEAVLIVQRAERARAARNETIIKRGTVQQSYKMKRQNQLSDREKSANIIKHFWWKYGSRCKEAKLREEEKELIGMKNTTNITALANSVAKVMLERKEEQRQQARKLKEQEEASTNWLKANKATDESRKYDVVAAAYYNKMKKFNKGKMDLKDVISTLDKFVDETEEEDPGFDEVLREKVKKYIEESGKKRRKKEEPVKKVERQMPTKQGKEKVELPVPETVKVLMENVEEFDKLWTPEAGADGTDNFNIDLVRKEMWEQMIPELIAKTKEKLTRELKNLKILDARRVKRARPPRNRQRRQRKVKDPFGGKPDEAILHEFVGYGIIKNVPTTTFDDFVGDYNITHPGDFADPNPTDSYAAIRNNVILEAVLPFAADRTQPFIKKSLLITGPKGCGKTTLAHAVVNALQATFFDLSPNVLVGKELPSSKQLITQVIAFAKKLAPSVILIDDAELMFGGRKIANASKRYKAQFGRNLKRLKARDCVFLLGTNTDPMAAAGMKLFDSVIKVPPPNFQTRVSIWNHWFAKCYISTANISVNALAFASEGCTAATIARAVKKAARVRASRTESLNPLTDVEILGFLAEAPLKEWGIEERKGRKGRKGKK